jgi:hypothetical protein
MEAFSMVRVEPFAFSFPGYDALGLRLRVDACVRGDFARQHRLAGVRRQLASIVLTFLAGAEVDPDDFKERFGACTSSIGRHVLRRARRDLGSSSCG